MVGSHLYYLYRVYGTGLPAARVVRRICQKCRRRWHVLGLKKKETLAAETKPSRVVHCPGLGESEYPLPKSNLIPACRTMLRNLFSPMSKLVNP